MISEGIGKVLAYKKETTWGELAGATGAKVVRRVTGTFNLRKDTYQSDEIRQDYQMADFRHGVRSVEGSINGELSPGSYADFIAAALSRDFTAGVSLTGVSATVTVVGMTYKVIRDTGSFVTGGIKVGDVVRFTGFTAPALANNNKNFLVANVTALELTIIPLNGIAPIAVGTAQTITVTVFGKKTFVPLTGHTDDSFTFEEFYPDILDSEVTTGNKVNTIGLQLPATGLTTVDVAFMGKDLAQTGSTQYFTNPTAANTNGIFASVNGVLLVNGVEVGLVTGLNININRNLSMEPVVGSNTHPDIFRGRVLVDGEFTAFYENGIIRDYFKDENEVSLVVVLTTAETPDAQFVSITLPRIKVNGADKDDGEKGIVRTHPFQALLNTTNALYDQTTIVVQDSAA